MYDIRFPNLGITFHNIKEGFSIFGFEIKYYGIIIALGFLIAYVIVTREAKRTGQNDEDYLDFILCMIIPAIIGARIYYVIFSWSDYVKPGKGFGKTLLDMINIRNGGLAIYGGLIAGFIVAYFFCKKRKIKLSLFADTAVMGILIGQIMGRWGNFFNREAFGDYTDSLFAMCIPTDYYGGAVTSLVESGVITEKMAQNVVQYDAMYWISVHPTFLYESLWNLALLICIAIYRKHKKFDGELVLLYIWGYGLGRVFVESLRTDSLMLPFGNIRVSQLVAAICVLTASILIVKKRMKYADNIVDKKAESKQK